MSGAFLCHDITYLYMYSNLTSYWAIMMTNNGHYRFLYMLNKYEISTYWTKNPMMTLVYQTKNTVDYHYLERIFKNSKMKTCNKTSRITLKDICLFFLVVFI